MTTGGLRASDADRDQIVEILQSAYSEGRITTDEHTERVQASIRSKTQGELAVLTADLVPWSPFDPGPRPVARSVQLTVEGTLDEPDRMTAAMSEVKRVGRWRIRRRSNVNVFLGSVQLDLTEAAFEVPLVEINVTQVLGSVFLRVPQGVTIRDETACVLAETSVRGIGEPDPARPTIVIRGTNLLGEIKVRGPKRPPPWKKALG